MKEWLIWLTGIAGIALSAITYIRNERKQMLVFKCLSDVCWIFHYFLLGGYTAVGTSIIAVFRSIVFISKDKKWAQGRKWLYIFLGIYLVLGIVSWEGFISLLPITSGVSATVGFWMETPAFVRYSAFPMSVSILIYDIVKGSTIGIIKDCLNISAAIAGFFMHDFKKKTKLDSKSSS